MEMTKVLMNDIFNSKGIITITGKHGVGKSCFVANIVKQAIFANKIVAVNSSEFTKEYMLTRLISLITDVGFTDLHKGTFEDINEINGAAGKIAKSNLHVSDNINIEEAIFSIKKLVRKLEKENKKIDLIVVDSLRYLINKRYKTIYDVFKYVNEELKDINIPMIVTYPISNEIKIPKSIRMNPTEEETKFIKDKSDIFISMERNSYITETIKLTIDNHSNKTHTIEYKFNTSTGEFTEK